MINGHISAAINLVNQLHPGLLENSKELMFQVHCRQFIETIAGYDRLPGRENYQQQDGEEMESDDKDMEVDVLEDTTPSGNCRIHPVIY